MVSIVRLSVHPQGWRRSVFRAGYTFFLHLSAIFLCLSGWESGQFFRLCPVAGVLPILLFVFSVLAPIGHGTLPLGGYIEAFAGGCLRENTFHELPQFLLAIVVYSVILK